jgi:AcrR family transcriptional regulator
MTEAPTLRDVARGAVRDEVSKAAWLLFAQQGYEGTTVDEIAEAAGMSRRTFFRYFTGKEELVLDQLVKSAGAVADALGERPVDESAWSALRAAFQVTVRIQEEHADTTRRLLRMLNDEPALRSVLSERRRRWEELLAPHVALRLPKRSGGRGPDPRARAIAASAIACLETAQEMWAHQEGARLSTLVDQAMSSVSLLPR